MPGLVDIHAHVIPGIDDGPPDLEEAVIMLSEAAASGISAIAATPHIRSDFPDVHLRELAARCQAVREASSAAGVDIELVLGAEVALVSTLDASQEDLTLASYGQRGSDLLIELPFSGAAPGLASLLYDLRLKGWRITLAHPERNLDFLRDPSPLVALVDQGILLQVNAEALLRDERKSDSARLCRWLCVEGLSHILASDSHRGLSWRPVTSLAPAAEALEQLVGAQRAHWMTQTAPRAIIDGAELPAAPPVVAAQRRSRRRLRLR